MEHTEPVLAFPSLPILDNARREKSISKLPGMNISETRAIELIRSFCEDELRELMRG